MIGWWFLVLIGSLYLGWRFWQRYDRFQRQQSRSKARPLTPRGPLPAGIRTRKITAPRRNLMGRVREEVRSRGALGGLIFFLIVVASLLLAIQIVNRFSGSDDYPHLVVAIAPFTNPDGSASPDGRPVAQALHHEWSQGEQHRLQRPLQLLLLSKPINTPEQALEVAQDHEADVVIWGTLEAGGQADAQSLRPTVLFFPRHQMPYERSLITRERVAMPPIYAPAAAPINGEAVLGPLLDILDLAQMGDLDAAIPALNALIDRYATNPAIQLDLAYTLRGIFALMKDEGAAAEADFRQALVTGSERAEYWNNLGVALMLQRRDDEAFQAFNTALSLSNNQLPQAYYNRGSLTLQTIDPGAAVADLLQAHTLRPDGVATLLTLAEAQRRSNHLNEAVAAVNLVVDLAPNDPLLALEMSRIQLAQLVGNGAQTQWELEIAPPLHKETLIALRERLDSATAAFEGQTLAMRQQSASADAAGKSQIARVYESNGRVLANWLLEARYWRSIALTEEGVAGLREQPGGLRRLWNGLFGDDPPLEQAQIALSKLTEDHENNIDFHLQLARTMALQQFHKTALEEYTRATELNSLRPEGWYGIALVLIAQPNPAEDRDARVRDALRQAITAEPRYTPAYVLQARFEMSHSNWEAALPPLEWLVAHRPELTEFHLRLGRVQRMAGLLAQAEQTLLPLANANDGTALVELGRVYVQAAHFDVAEQIFQRAIDIDGNNALAAYELGRLAQDRGEFARAELAYQQAIRVNPNYVEAHLALGQLYNRSLNRPDLAIESYQAAIKVGNQDARSYEDLGRAFLEIGAYEQAADALERSVGLSPNTPESRHLLAQAYIGIGRFETAREQEREAIARTSGGVYPDAQVGIGETFRRQGRFDEAIAAYNVVLDSDPNNSAAYVGLGRTSADQRDWQGAIGYYNQAIARDGTSAPAHFWLAEALSEQGFYSRALEEYEAALVRDQEFTEAYYGLGRVYSRLALLEPPENFQQIAENEAKARQFLDEALRRRPNYGEAFLERGQLNERQGQDAAALADYAQASTALPNNAQAPFLRGKLLLSVNDVAGGTEALEVSVDRDGSYAPAHYWLGRAYRAQGRTDDALARFNRALELNPGATEARYFLGLTLQETNQLDAARAAYNVIVAQAPPDDGWRQQAEERLRAIGP